MSAFAQVYTRSPHMFMAQRVASARNHRGIYPYQTSTRDRRLGGQRLAIPLSKVLRRTPRYELPPHPAGLPDCLPTIVNTRWCGGRLIVPVPSGPGSPKSSRQKSPDDQSRFSLPSSFRPSPSHASYIPAGCPCKDSTLLRSRGTTCSDR